MLIGVIIIIVFGILLLIAVHGRMPPISLSEIEDAEADDYWAHELREIPEEILAKIPQEPAPTEFTREDLLHRLGKHAPCTGDLSYYMQEFVFFIRDEELLELCETIPGLLADNFWEDAQSKTTSHES